MVVVSQSVDEHVHMLNLNCMSMGSFESQLQSTTFLRSFSRFNFAHAYFVKKNSQICKLSLLLRGLCIR